MPNLRKQLDKAIKKKFIPEVKKKIKQSAEIIGEELVNQSTVDTGLFAANWLPGVDEERADTKDYEDFGASPLRVRGKRSISEEKAKKVATDIPDFELGQEIIFSNSVEHLEYFDSFSDAVAGAKVGRDKAKSKVEK
jgi:hypothetical protein